MFQHRSSQFDPRLTAIAGHLRAIERELGGLGRGAGRRAAASASAAGSQISDAIAPILSEIVDRFGRGQRVASDQAVALGNQAADYGTQFGKNAVQRLSTEVENRPLVTLAVAIGVGIFIGLATRRR